VRWSGSQEAAAFNENPSRATVNGFGTLDVAAGAARLSVKTLRPGQEDFDDSEYVTVIVEAHDLLIGAVLCHVDQ